MTLTIQFTTMITMVLSGVFIGASYHTFKRLEHLWFHRIFWRYIFEIVFWILHVLLLYYVLYIVNEGILRFYVFLSIFCGYAMFKSLLERVYNKILDYIFRLIRYICGIIYKIVSFLIIQPIVWLVSLVIVIIMKLFSLVGYIVLLCWKIVSCPFKWVFLQFVKLLPKKAQKYLHHYYSKYSKIKKK